MARWLQLVSDLFPLTYSYDALARLARGTTLTGRFALDVVVTLGAALIALGLGALTLRRRTS